jgi:hypothetical protein
MLVNKVRHPSPQKCFIVVGLPATVSQLHEHISVTSPASQVIHDYATPVAPEAGILAFMPEADESYEIFDGILNSLPEIPVANVMYSDFNPFGDCMDMGNPLNASHSVNWRRISMTRRRETLRFPTQSLGI